MTSYGILYNQMVKWKKRQLMFGSQMVMHKHHAEMDKGSIAVSLWDTAERCKGSIALKQYTDHSLYLGREQTCNYIRTLWQIKTLRIQ